jgi:hypothetical protein
MSTTESRDAVTSFLRAEFRREQASGYALLRLIPSTSVRKFLDYFAALDSADRDALSEALAQVALFSFFPTPPHPSLSDNVAYKRYTDSMALMWDLRYEGTRGLRMLLAEARMSPDPAFAGELTKEMMEMIRAIKPVKAPEIRRVVKLALSQLFAPIDITHAGSDWHYEGLYQGREICVAIDYGGSAQLRYEVSIRDKERRIKLEGLSYERIMGLSFAAWNCLEQSNLDQSIALFKDLIAYCIELPRRLPAVYEQ